MTVRAAVKAMMVGATASIAASPAPGATTPPPVAAASARVVAEQDPVPGFKAYLGGRRRGLVECSVFRKRLRCLVYDAELPDEAECDLGGAVPTVAMRPRGRARRTYACIDEAYHGWDTLRVGATFRQGPFTCTRTRRRLRCANEDHRFTVFASGRIRRSG
jgi:hypothetical protein